ncbi:MAG: cell envelope integrity protein TolA [Proteobacteria bacterium]|nr:cell envelope integrity protein TolA [Pseudomonadota bacterium]
MKSKTAHSLIISLILTVGHLTSVTAVTDAELEALEKQIEQQEAEEIKRAEAEAKRRAEAEKLAEEKKRLVELEKQRQEEARLAEIERQRREKKIKKQEMEVAQKLEKERNDKLNSLMAKAEDAKSSNDYELAITKYNYVLEEFPDNTEALSNIDRIKLILENCKSILGKWDWFNGAIMDYKPDGTFVWTLLISGGGSWECINPEKNEFYMTHTNNSQWDGPIWVVDKGQKLKGKDPNLFGGEFMGRLPPLTPDQKKPFQDL